MSGTLVFPTPPSTAPSGTAGGDLGGTFPNPSVLRTFSVKSSTSDIAFGMAAAPSAGQIPVALSASEVEWQTPSGGGSLIPGVVPDLLTVGLPALGSTWLNAPVYGGTAMIQTTGNGFAFITFGGCAYTADTIGVQCDSVALPNQGTGWYQLAGPEADLAHRPWARGRVKISATATDQAVYVGWSPTGAPFGAGGSTIPTNSVLLTIDNSTGSWGDTTWKIRSRAAGAITTIDTLVPFMASHDYELYLSADAVPSVTWAIYDRTAGIAYGSAGVALANAPASTQALAFAYYGISGAAGASQRLTWGPCTRGNFGPT